MTKEALYGIDPIFKEGFQSEQSTYRNGGVPTDVVYSNGVGTFNGASSVISNESKSSILNNSSECSFRVIITPLSITGNSTIISRWFQGFNMSFLLRLDSGRPRLFLSTSKTSTGNPYQYADNAVEVNRKIELIVTFNSGISYIYIDGVEVPSTANGALPSIITSIDERLDLGDNRGIADEEFDGSMDLVEVYPRALTAEEVSNLYNNVTYRDVNTKDLAFDFDTRRGVVQDNYGNALIQTGVTVEKRPGYEAKFTELVSSVDASSVLSKVQNASVGTVILDARFDKTDDAVTGLVVFSISNSANTTQMNFNRRPTGEARISYNLAGVSQWVFDSDDAVIVDGESFQLVMRQDGTTAKMYFNGVFIDQTLFAGVDLTKWFDSATFDSLYIGAILFNGKPAPTNNWAGWIKRARIFNRVLSDEEIAQAYSYLRKK